MRKYVKNFLIYAFCCLISVTACKKDEIIKDYTNPTSKPAMLLSISITTPATKLVYTVGEPLDLTGLKVTGIYSDSSKRTETVTPANVTGFNSSVPVISQVLTITVKDKKTTYTITVQSQINPDIAAVAADKAALVDTSIQGANTDLAHITVALTNPLPLNGLNGSVITWLSSDTTVVSNDGKKIVRPAFGQPNTAITFTATLNKGVVSETKAFALTVLAKAANTTDSFRITDIDHGQFGCGGPSDGYYDFIGGFSITGTYFNSTEEAICIWSGTIWYGDGVSETFSALGQLWPKGNIYNNGTFQIGAILRTQYPHEYPAPGIYHIKIELTAPFPDGAITSSFEKDMTFNCKYFLITNGKVE